MNQDILIISHFTSGLEDDTNGRFSYLAQLLSGKANVEIVTSDFIHEKKSHISDEYRDYSYKCTFLHEPGYSTNVSLKRFYSHKVFGENVKDYLHKRRKPDLIYCAVPSLTAACYAAEYCSQHKVKYVIDIQDLWPEAFKMVFDPPIIGHGMYKPFERLANKIYSSADMIVAVSQTYVRRAKSVNLKSRINKAVYLGTDLSEFDRNASLKELRYSKTENDIWLGYCGTLGSSYDLNIVFRALYQLEQKGSKSPTFVIMGDGPKEDEFKRTVTQLGVRCIFTGRLPYSEMCATLKQCDMVVNPIMHKAAQSIINKHADYAASGLPVLNTQESREYQKLVERYQMGFNCFNQSADELTEYIDLLMKSSELRTRMGENARICAERYFDRRKTYQKLAEKLLAF